MGTMLFSAKRAINLDQSGKICVVLEEHGSVMFRLNARKMWICRWAAAIAIAAGLLASQSHRVNAAEPQAAPSPKPNAPAVSPPASGSAEEGQPLATVVVPATIQAFFVTDLYAKNAGYVSQINYDIGDHVKKGDVLALIDNPELQAQFERAQAAVAQSRAALDVAKRQFAGMEADLVLQRLTLERQKELFAGKAATAQTLDEARAKEGVANAAVETGKAKISLAEADLQAAKAEADRLQALVQYDRITAPFDGVVTRRLVNPGDLVQSATATRTAPLFTCQKIDVVRVVADAPEASAASIRPGTPAEVKLFDAGETTIRGSVTRVATALDPATRTMRVEIDLPNPDEKFQPGMYARVTLGLEPRKLGAVTR
jgi:multidrug efflux pump subunit AcrA (membrane-fusion protein)